VSNFDWLDDFLEDTEAPAEYWQIDRIDELLKSFTGNIEEADLIYREASSYTAKEAAIKISYLYENQCINDPGDRFKFFNNK
jgi:hypothetical protein|tara:strand:+ start:81 stop:326 length:246 start_codon:yes stop_codon:yes gene_type:complete